METNLESATPLIGSSTAFAAITVANISGEPITVIDIQGWSPPGVALTSAMSDSPCLPPSPMPTQSPEPTPESTPAPQLSCTGITHDETRLDPGRSRTYPFSITTNEKLQPGPALLLFDASANGPTVRSSAVISQKVNLGVLGESAALGLLSVPALIFLPGFVAVVAFGWAAGKLPGISTFTPSATEPSTWVLAVPVSFAIVAIYGPLTGLGPIEGIVHGPRSLTGPHDLTDIFLAWALALVLGVIAAVILWVVVHAAGWGRAIRAWETRRRNEIKKGDEPITVLERLGNQRLGLVLPQVRDAQGRTALVAGRSVPSDGSMVTIIPMMQIIAPFPADQAARDILDDLKRQLTDQGDPHRLAVILRRPEMTVKWRRGIVAVPDKQSFSAAQHTVPQLVADLDVKAPDVPSAAAVLATRPRPNGPREVTSP